jgi:hypothetical protein
VVLHRAPGEAAPTAVPRWRSLEALHPVEAAVGLCDDAELVRVARQWSYDAPDDVAGIRRLLEPPPIDADRSPRYCPRCGGGYAAFATECADCRIPLIARAS